MKNRTEEIILAITSEIKKSSNQIKSTISDIGQFELNLRSEFIYNYLKARLDFILEQKNYIGKEVFKFKDNRFSYISKEDYELLEDKIFNKIESNPLIMTDNMFDEFVEKYIQFQIDKITEFLTDGFLYENSTSILSNFKYMIRVQCNQYLLYLLRDIKVNS